MIRILVGLISFSLFFVTGGIKRTKANLSENMKIKLARDNSANGLGKA